MAWSPGAAPVAATQWTSTSITVTVPAGREDGELYVTRSGVSSNAVVFAVDDEQVLYYHTDALGRCGR